MKDFIVSLVFLFISVSSLVISEGFNRKGEHAYSLAFNPAIYPRIFAVILLVLSCVLMYQSIRKGALKNIKINMDRGKAMKVARLFIAIVLYLGAINFVGYIISTALFIFIFVRLYDGKLTQAIFCAVGATIVLYLIFHVGFKIELPVGFIFE